MNALQIRELEELEGLDLNNTTEQKYEINNLNSLNWAFRKLNAYKAELKEKQEFIQSELDRIKEWEREETYKINENINFFRNLIAEYHAKVLAEDPKKKTLSTPYGKSKSTTSKAQPDKADEEQLIKFVEDNQLPFVEKVPKLKWAELKKTLQVVEVDGVQKVVDENGQEVPGVTVKPQTTTFKVEI